MTFVHVAPYRIFNGRRMPQARSEVVFGKGYALQLLGFRIGNFETVRLSDQGLAHILTCFSRTLI